MSMIFEMVGITPAQIAAIRETPQLANDLLTLARSDNDERHRKEMHERLSPEKRAQAEARYGERRSDPNFLEALKEITQARQRAASIGPIESALDLQKSWHILHYAITGDIGPVGSPGDALLVGEDIGEDTTGYGPARLHPPEATREFAKVLMALTIGQIQSRANFQKMTQAGVYSMPMGPGSEAEFEDGIRREIESYFPLLRNYVSAMADKGNGLLMWIT